jgi:very-short-patch-repair endonuclease
MRRVPMNPETVDERLHALLGRTPVATWDELVKAAPKHVVAHAVRTGELVRAAPRVYVRSGSDDKHARLLAAAKRVDGFGALSHTTALNVWGMDVGGEDIHLTVPRSAQLASSQGVIIHRRAGFWPRAPHTVVRNGLDVVRLERALADSWALIEDPVLRRATVIASVRERRTTPDRLQEEVVRLPRLTGRASLLALLDLLRDGCQSELEIWGYLRVFDHPLLSAGRRQYPVKLPGGRTAYLDLAYPEERVAVELDGAEHHFGPSDRERDMRRDAALSQLGWLVVRVSHRRLTTDPDGVREELIAILQRRRYQLGIAAAR